MISISWKIIQESIGLALHQYVALLNNDGTTSSLWSQVRPIEGLSLRIESIAIQECETYR